MNRFWPFRPIWNSPCHGVLLRKQTGTFFAKMGYLLTSTGQIPASIVVSAMKIMPLLPNQHSCFHLLKNTTNPTLSVPLAADGRCHMLQASLLSDNTQHSFVRYSEKKSQTNSRWQYSRVHAPSSARATKDAAACLWTESGAAWVTRVHDHSTASSHPTNSSQGVKVRAAHWERVHATHPFWANPRKCKSYSSDDVAWWDRKLVGSEYPVNHDQVYTIDWCTRDRFLEGLSPKCWYKTDSHAQEKNTGKDPNIEKFPFELRLMIRLQIFKHKWLVP